MKDEEIIAIAKQVWGERLGVEYSTSEPVGYADCNHTFKPTNKLIAFARAIEDIQKQKDAQIAECEWQLMKDTEVAHSIRSQETDID